MDIPENKPNKLDDLKGRPLFVVEDPPILNYLPLPLLCYMAVLYLAVKIYYLVYNSGTTAIVDRFYP